MVDDNGTCASCLQAAIHEVEQHGRIYRESIELVNNSKKVDTRLHRCELAQDKLNEMRPHQKIGLVDISPSIDQAIEELEEYLVKMELEV